MPARPQAIRARVVLLDIEGTTTPIAFVYDVLFPFARAHLDRYLTEHASSPALRGVEDALRAEHGADLQAGNGPPPWPEQSGGARREPLAAYVRWLMDRDRKSTGLKALQGLIWEQGYRSGELRGRVFDDVPAALESWRRQGIRVAIFSSGSIRAQQLLFRHSNAGDLTPLIDAHFDTATGSKIERESYGEIAGRLGCAPPEILFVSDVVRELDAARAAGVQTQLIVRAGNPPQPEGHGHPVVGSLSDLM